jgi:hypothetical protein
VRKSKAQFDEAAAIIDHWVQTLDLDDTGEVDSMDIDSETQALDAINLLTWHGASETELAHAVRRARHHGATWRRSQSPHPPRSRSRRVIKN